MLMTNIARILLAFAAAAIIVCPLGAEERGQQRYIVVIRQHRSGSPVPDIARLGGTIESRQDDQLVVTIPAGALAALKSDPAVLYLQRVGGPADDESPLIGEPADPQPGAPSKRFTPRALGTITWDSGTYAYDGAGNIVSIGSDNYLYDGVQRLTQSSTKGMVETYRYDGFGNIIERKNNGAVQPLPGVETATNRSTGAGYAYNEVGAMTSGASYVFTYDALGQPLSKKYNNDDTTQEYYIYTANDERIGVLRNNWWTWSVRDEGGKVLRQYKSSATNTSAPALWLEDFVWRDGLLLGSQRPVEMGGRRHFHLDHLGTPRLITSDAGQMVSYHDYYPFGDEYSPVKQEVLGGFDREEPTKFTGHERDYAGGTGAEDGHAVDYMHARYYSPTVGRFLSVDPAGWDIGLPQSFNRYSYALNNPIRYNDPDGRCTDPLTCVAEGLALPAAGMVLIDAAVVTGVVFSIGSVTLNLHPEPVVVPAALVNPIYAAEHVKGARPSTENKHQQGEARRAQDRGKEKGDERRRPPRRRPPDWKGPWPPKVVPIPPEPKKTPPPPPPPKKEPPPKKDDIQ
jgi:RHS repeat-associated protein